MDIYVVWFDCCGVFYFFLILLVVECLFVVDDCGVVFCWNVLMGEKVW